MGKLLSKQMNALKQHPKTMKYILALFCLIGLIVNTPSTQAYHSESFLTVSYEIAEAVPIEKRTKKAKKRALKFKQNKQPKEKQFKQQTANRKGQIKYILILIGGILLAILSVVLLTFLAPTTGVAVTGVVMGVAKFLGWTTFIVAACAALMLVWIGIAGLVSTSKTEAPLTPTEQLVADSAKKYPNIPLKKIEEYVALKEEIKELEKEKRKETSQEKLRILETELEEKQQKQVFLEALNDELEVVAEKKRTEYIFLKEAVYILNSKKALLERSKDPKDKEKVKEIDAEIEWNFTKMKILRNKR